MAVVCIFSGAIPVMAGVFLLSTFCIFELFRMFRFGHDEKGKKSVRIFQSGLLFLGAIFILVFLGASIAIRMMPEGAWWLFLAVAVTSSCDIGAFAFGKVFGRHKLAPKISPGKTMEGFAGGLFCGTLACFFAGERLALPVQERIALGVLLGFAAISGDLFESFLKRKAGVKDSGSLVLGHGGILDRLDSHLFSLPTLYLYLRLFGF